MKKPQPVLMAEALVGEGPVVDFRSGRLVWVDIPAGELHEWDRLSGHDRTTVIDYSLGAAVPTTADEGFAVAYDDGFGLVVGGELMPVEPFLKSDKYRMNDAKVDSSGRLWGGSTHKAFVSGQGRLHRWDGLGPSQEIRVGFTLPNGIGWSPDDDIIYVADSFQHTIFMADFDAASGEVDRWRRFADVTDGLPDGLAIDHNGDLWLAVWGAGKIRRFDQNGAWVEDISFPVSQVSSCAFLGGGALVATSARSGLDDSQLRDQPLAGALFLIDVGVEGVATASFRVQDAP